MGSSSAQYCDFELPSFSLGLDDGQHLPSSSYDVEVPSFSLGIDDLLPPTPAVAEERADGHEVEFIPSFSQADARKIDFDIEEETPKRTLKRLRRGPARRSEDVNSCVSQDKVLNASHAEPSIFATQNMMEPKPSAADEIEEFSSEEEQPNLQKYNSRTFSALKPTRTPPVFEKKQTRYVEQGTPSSSSPAFPSHVNTRKTGLNSKEVRFQGIPATGDIFRTPNSTQSTKTYANASSTSRFQKVTTPVYEFRDNCICIDIDEDDGQTDVSALDNDERIARLLRERLPFFSSIDDLEQGNGDEPVYIDYRAQFGANRTTTTSTNLAGKGGRKSPAQTNSKAKGSKRKNRSTGNSQPVLQESCNRGTTTKKGYWLTEGGRKVYVTADGQRLAGKPGYQQYLKDDGRLDKKRPQKQKQPRKRKQN